MFDRTIPRHDRDITITHYGQDSTPERSAQEISYREECARLAEEQAVAEAKTRRGL